MVCLKKKYFLFNNYFKYFTEICSYNHSKTKSNRFLNFNGCLNFAALGPGLTDLSVHPSLDESRVFTSQVPTNHPPGESFLI